MASIRLASSVSRSRKAAVAPADFASATSSALAARIADAPRGWPWPWRQAHGSCAPPAPAPAHGRHRAPRGRCSRMAASSLPELRTALSGAFMALIRLAFVASYHVRRDRARRPRAKVVHSGPQPFVGRSQKPGNLPRCRQRFAPGSHQERVPWVCRQIVLSSRLPRRFPVGANYVVEGYGGGEGKFARHCALCGLAGRAAHQCSVPIFPARRRARAAPSFPAQLKFQTIPSQKAAPRAAAKNLRRGGEPPSDTDVDWSSAGRSPPAPHPQSPGVEPRPRQAAGVLSLADTLRTESFRADDQIVAMDHLRAAIEAENRRDVRR